MIEKKNRMKKENNNEKDYQEGVQEYNDICIMQIDNKYKGWYETKAREVVIIPFSKEEQGWRNRIKVKNEERRIIRKDVHCMRERERQNNEDMMR